VSGALSGPLLVVGVLLALLLATRLPTRVDITVKDDAVRIRPGRLDGVLALRKQLRFPLNQVQGVAAVARQQVPATGVRLPGTSFPGLIRCGSFGTGAGRDFWLVRRPNEVLVIQLAPGAAYRRIVLEVPDPHAEALRLQPLLGAYTGTFADR
jgi:hypothetical protein